MKILRYMAPLALAGLMLTGVPQAPAQNPDSPEISRLLAQAEANAARADDEASQLASFTRSRVSWQSHAEQIETFKKHINALVDDVNQLAALRDQGSPWQQDAIDRTSPLMQEMSELLTNTITHLNENQNRIHMSAYRDYVDANEKLAHKLLVLIRGYVDYDEAKSKAASLEQQLSVPVPGDAEME